MNMLNPAAVSFMPRMRQQFTSKLSPLATHFVPVPPGPATQLNAPMLSRPLNAAAEEFVPKARRLDLVFYVDPLAIALTAQPKLNIQAIIDSVHLTRRAEDLASQYIYQPTIVNMPLWKILIAPSIPLLCIVNILHGPQIFMAILQYMTCQLNTFYDQFQDDYEEIDESEEYNPLQPLLLNDDIMVHRPGLEQMGEWETNTIFPEDEASSSASTNSELSSLLTQLSGSEPVHGASPAVSQFELFLATQDGFTVQTEAAKLKQYDEDDIVCVDERHSAHHICFLQYAVYCKTATDPALSLAIINTLPKGAMSAKSLELAANLHDCAVLYNAFAHIDPVIYFGKHVELIGLTAAQIRDKACGQVSKFYQAVGQWQRDEYAEDEDSPLCDVNKPEYCSENFTIYNGLMNNAAQPDRAKFFNAVDWIFEQEQKELKHIQEQKAQSFRLRTVLDPEHKPLRASPLRKVYTPDSMITEDKNIKRDYLRPTTKSWADLDEEHDFNDVLPTSPQLVKYDSTNAADDTITTETALASPGISIHDSAQQLPATIATTDAVAVIPITPEYTPAQVIEQPVETIMEPIKTDSPKICLLCAGLKDGKLYASRRLLRMVRGLHVPDYLTDAYAHKSCARNLAMGQLRHKRLYGTTADISRVTIIESISGPLTCNLPAMLPPAIEPSVTAEPTGTEDDAAIDSKIFTETHAQESASPSGVALHSVVVEESLPEDTANETISPISTPDIERLVLEAVAKSGTAVSTHHALGPETPTKSGRSVSETFFESPKSVRASRARTFPVFNDEPAKKPAPQRTREAKIPRSEKMWDLNQAFKDAQAQKDAVKQSVKELSQISEDEEEDAFLDIAQSYSETFAHSATETQCTEVHESPEPKIELSSNEHVGRVVETTPISVLKYNQRKAHMHVLTPIQAASPYKISEQQDEVTENLMPISPPSA